MMVNIVFWTYTFFWLIPIIIALFTSEFSKWYIVGIVFWIALVIIRHLPTGSDYTQYLKFCEYRSRCPSDLLPKMNYKQLKQLLSVKELEADFLYVKTDYNKGAFIKADYYGLAERNNPKYFIVCYISGQKRRVILNPATYFDYFLMCSAVKKGLKSLCTKETVDTQLDNLKDIREVIHDVQDKEIAKLKNIASENQEIEKRIINDRKAKIKAK